jgi:hypothetical protein
MIDEAKKYMIFKVQQNLNTNGIECTRENIESLMSNESFRETSLREFLEATAA